MTDTAKRIAEIEERLTKASPQPWRIDEESCDRHLRDADGNSLMCDTTYYPWAPDSVEDWKLIAEAPADIRFLLDRVRELEEMLDIGEPMQPVAVVSIDVSEAQDARLDVLAFEPDAVVFSISHRDLPQPGEQVGED